MKVNLNVVLIDQVEPGFVHPIIKNIHMYSFEETPGGIYTKEKIKLQQLYLTIQILKLYKKYVKMKDSKTQKINN